MMIFAAISLFLVGLWLSAFFSGSETGFYRVSFVRLSIDAHAGDRAAKRILWFARRPAAFVATTLVGNNFANYLTILGISFAVAAVANSADVAGGWEIVTTLAVSPIIFLFGELMPKNLFLRSPQYRLLRNATLFQGFYVLFFLISYPLKLITHWLERLAPPDEQSTTPVLGRKWLVQVLAEGHEQGLLSEIQDRLVSGLLSTATDPVDASLVPHHRVLGLPETSSRADLLAHARRYGLTEVAVHRAGQPGEWFGCLRVVDLAVREEPTAGLIIELPIVPSGSSHLEALLTLNESTAPLGVVTDDGQVRGLVSRRQLTSQLVQPQAPA